MPALEVWGSGGRDVFTLDGARLTVGTNPDAGIVVESDATVSRVHLVVEEVGPAWCVRDLGSRNGTFVNGERLISERVLRHGDEIVLGRTRLVFRDREHAEGATTAGLAPPPDLTPRERTVLVELCRPLLLGNAFTQPAAVRDIAEVLVVSQAAVKQHLGHLYDKFLIEGTGETRRVRLANEALQRGAVKLADLRPPTDDPTADGIAPG